MEDEHMCEYYIDLWCRVCALEDKVSKIWMCQECFKCEEGAKTCTHNNSQFVDLLRYYDEAKAKLGV